DASAFGAAELSQRSGSVVHGRRRRLACCGVTHRDGGALHLYWHHAHEPQALGIRPLCFTCGCYLEPNSRLERAASRRGLIQALGFPQSFLFVPLVPAGVVRRMSEAWDLATA